MQIKFTKTVVVDRVLFENGTIADASEITAGHLQSLLANGDVIDVTEQSKTVVQKPDSAVDQATKPSTKK